MTALRIAIVVIASATAAIAFHLNGLAFWIANTVGYGLAAALAVYALWQDEMLRDVLAPKGFDLTLGVAGAALLFGAVVLLWIRVVAPSNVLGGLLRKCTVEGVLLPRLDAHGLDRVLDWIRGQVCRGYGRSLAVTGAERGAWIAAIAVLEEIGWRGGVQQFFSEKLGSTRGWIAASLLNAGAYLLCGNLMIALLALPCALVWGGFYRYRGRLAPSLASHVAFSYTLFHSFPLVSFR